MSTNGGSDHGVGNDTELDLEAIIDGLRGGDLSGVFTVAVRLGGHIAAHPDAAAHGRDTFVHEVVLALADLAVAPGGGDQTADRLLAAAINRACLTLSA